METAPTAERGSAARAAKRNTGGTLTGRTRARESISGVWPSMHHMKEGLMKARNKKKKTMQTASEHPWRSFYIQKKFPKKILFGILNTRRRCL